LLPLSNSSSVPFTGIVDLHHQFHVTQAFFSGGFILFVLLDAFRKVVGFGHEM
jgi:hypothetical protein